MALRKFIAELGRGPGTGALAGVDPGAEGGDPLMAVQFLATVPRVSVGTDAKMVGAVFLPTGTYNLRAFLGTLEAGVTATLELRVAPQGALVTDAQVTGSGDVAARGPALFYNSSDRWLEVMVYTNAAGGSAVVEGASLESV